jgi:hypothetical protein
MMTGNYGGINRIKRATIAPEFAGSHEIIFLGLK